MNKGSDKGYAPTRGRVGCGSPTINGNDLMSGYSEFMDKDLIKKKCFECLTKSTCLAICDLLSHGRNKEASLLLPKQK